MSRYLVTSPGLPDRHVSTLWLAKDGSCLREHKGPRALCGRDLDVAQSSWYFGRTHPTCKVCRERNPLQDNVPE